MMQKTGSTVYLRSLYFARACSVSKFGVLVAAAARANREAQLSQFCRDAVSITPHGENVQLRADEREGAVVCANAEPAP
jgi:hypothetical protein